MKKIEKDLILKDLEFINNECNIKSEKLKTIISLFMDEEPELAQQTAEKDYKKAEDKANHVHTEEHEDEPKIEDKTGEETNNIMEQNNEFIELPDDIKTLFRKIVMITHPDRNNNEYYIDLYKRTIKAKKDNDICEIIYISYLLKINEVYNIDDDYFNSIKKKIKEKEVLSTNISYNSFWIWYHTENKELKKVMVGEINKNIKNLF